jgi:hypothetical protein
LNTASFRIAAQLEDHPRKKVVEADPACEEAQGIVSQLVRQVHEHADDLKDNLRLEGQNEPGLITRDGRLINANTRCVLLRELAREGVVSTSTLRVAVLPGDLSNDELLEIELVLQQQQTFKDEYRLVNELLMIKRLHDAHMSDAQIAQRRRFPEKAGRSGAAEVKLRREILLLMERARRLHDPILPLTTFDVKHSQLQNWSELLNEVNKLDEREKDEHIRRWLCAFLVGIDSVHDLRNAKGAWIEVHLVPEIKEHPDLRSIVDEDLIPEVVPSTPEQAAMEALPLPGLELLSDDIDTVDKTEPSAAVHSLFSTIVAAQANRDGWIDLPDGRQASGTEVIEQLKTLVDDALDGAKRSRDAGTRIDKPFTLLNRARVALRDAHEALVEVISDEEFVGRVAQAKLALAEVEQLAERVSDLLASATESFEE